MLPQTHNNPLARDYQGTYAMGRAEEPPVVDNDFNDLYDISEGEEEVADIPISITVPDSPLAPRQRKHLTQLMVPDAAAWPTVQTRQKAAETPLIAQTELLTPFLTAPRTELSR